MELIAKRPISKIRGIIKIKALFIRVKPAGVSRKNRQYFYPAEKKSFEIERFRKQGQVSYFFFQ